MKIWLQWSKANGQKKVKENIVDFQKKNIKKVYNKKNVQKLFASVSKESQNDK